ncbi:GTP cyclohydrolase I FolE [Clostridium sp.]|uniref:GTP cyclohydrolase I FolE n=1 Tax=Clostridium sp. TaxID=1506 RepID=UPI003F352E2A
MAIDKEKIEYHIREILIALGDNPDREGLKETPKRVANMYEEIFEGINYTNEEIAELFGKTFEEEEVDKSGDLVVVREIPIHSYCEHHLALMYNMKVSVVYKPRERVIGLSKIARIADMVGRRLQLQERIGADIASIVSNVTDSEDVGVLIEGEHSCMSARGIKKTGALTRTTSFRGIFENDTHLRQEAILLMKS